MSSEAKSKKMRLDKHKNASKGRPADEDMSGLGSVVAYDVHGTILGGVILMMRNVTI